MQLDEDVPEKAHTARNRTSQKASAPMKKHLKESVLMTTHHSMSVMSLKQMYLVRETVLMSPESAKV